LPELPEVETVVRDLRPRLAGRPITRVWAGRRALRRPWRRAWARALVGRRIQSVGRRGKWIVVALDGGPCLVVHLGMTGQLTVADVTAPRADHTHLVVGLGGGRELRFRDTRRFGSATLFPDRAALDAAFARAGLGPEPFGLDPAYWRGRLAATGRSLKAVLLDQRVVAGVGNIYADESLWEARLHPARPGRSLSSAEAVRLRGAVEAVLTRAIARRGSSIRDYVDGAGARGGYQSEFRVYGRAGAPCPRCGTSVEATRLAGRSTHFCPRCQPAGGRGAAVRKAPAARRRAAGGRV
jgi:formamidopyrimidine-DNA glycosylase